MKKQYTRTEQQAIVMVGELLNALKLFDAKYSNTTVSIHEWKDEPNIILAISKTYDGTIEAIDTFATCKIAGGIITLFGTQEILSREEKNDHEEEERIQYDRLKEKFDPKKK